MFAGLAACCLHLHVLRVRLPAFCPEALAGLSELRSLTTLELEEDQHDGEDGGYVLALLQQLATLTALTRLGLMFGGRYFWQQHAPMSTVLPALAALPLRSLELTGRCWLDVSADFPALAAALPSLERLHCVQLIGGEGLGAVAWHMPNLAAIEVGVGEPVDRTPSQAALDVAAGCPALQRLGPLDIPMDMLTLLPEGASDALNAAVAQRLVQGLGAMAARGLLAHCQIQLRVHSPAHVDALCAAMEQLQPAEHGIALASRCFTLNCLNIMTADVGRLVACLPDLRQVINLGLVALPLLAPLRHLVKVEISTAVSWRRAVRAALQAFAEQRAEEIGMDLDSAPVRVYVMSGGRGHMRVMIQDGEMHHI